MKEEKKRKKKEERVGEQKQAKKKGGQGTRLNEFSLIFFHALPSPSHAFVVDVKLDSLTQLPPTAAAAWAVVAVAVAVVSSKLSVGAWRQLEKLVSQ